MTSPKAPRASSEQLLAHFSDPHLPLTGGIPLAMLLNKRMFGFLSWYRHRRHRHRFEVLQQLVADLHAERPEQIIVTGDLTNLGLEAEFKQAAAWLAELGAPDCVGVIPGNHEAYVRGAWEAGAAYWHPYWAGDDAKPNAAAGAAQSAFPWLRIRGNMALIGLSSARPSALGLAIGTLGPEQLARLAAILERTRQMGLFRVVMLHHPVLDNAVIWRKRLLDAAKLQTVLGEHGVELVLHGHGHKKHTGELATVCGIAPVFGVPSASSAKAERAAYHLYRIKPAPEGWALNITARALNPSGLDFTQTWTQNILLLRER
ncbi:MAG: metallophosphoesterase [Gammaproteobacteria bacterium HGW-Gammaproteobacteria-3]|nr:MAG: metallophosphoesterase [Gammaproteobacteria bacterium HGW-Gammaproteobacteria-3]